MSLIEVNGHALRYEKLPERFQDSLERYLEYGIQPGHFLTAVLCNDLMNAIGRADDESLAALPAVCKWLYNEAPGNAFGSKEKVIDWCAKRREEVQR